MSQEIPRLSEHRTAGLSPKESLIAIGANQESRHGSALQTCLWSVSQIAASGLHISAVSRFFRTPCFPAGAGPDYINAAVTVRAHWSEHDILMTLHDIEKDAGRARSKRWAQRPLDLDLLICGQKIIPDKMTLRHWIEMDITSQSNQSPEDLILPHPRLQDRAFVLGPMRDIAPDWHHPTLRKSVRQMWSALPDAARREIKPV